MLFPIRFRIGHSSQSIVPPTQQLRIAFFVCRGGSSELRWYVTLGREDFLGGVGLYGFEDNIV
jgi:hypothetical protein